MHVLKQDTNMYSAINYAQMCANLVANDVHVRTKLVVSHIESKKEDGIFIASQTTFVDPVTFQDKIRVNEIEGDDGVIILSPVTFTGPVHGIELIKMVKCDACEYEQPGFQFDEKTVCLECIRDIAIQFRAKESWAENNGDPMKLLLERVQKLEEQIKPKN